MEMLNRAEFARLLGCSRQAILKAERAGYLIKGMVYKNGQALFDVREASRSWATFINPSIRNQPLVTKLHELGGLVDPNKPMTQEEFDAFMDKADRLIEEALRSSEKLLEKILIG